MDSFRVVLSFMSSVGAITSATSSSLSMCVCMACSSVTRAWQQVNNVVYRCPYKFGCIFIYNVDMCAVAYMYMCDTTHLHVLTNLLIHADMP